MDDYSLMPQPFAELDGQVAIITGGAKGIGQGCARLLAMHGVQVVVADIDEEAGRETVQQIADASGAAIFSPTDVGDHEQIRVLVDETMTRFGRLDMIVNNAYWSVRKSVVDLTEDEWDKGMNVMLKAVYLFGKYGFPAMQKSRELGKGLGKSQGAIVNVSSVHGLAAAPNYPVYATAKAGLINLTRQMAVDGGRLGIRVNAICPGWVRTSGMADFGPELTERMVKLYPVGRGGVPLDIANAVRFLVSDQASFITGHSLVVDGGLTAQLQDSII